MLEVPKSNLFPSGEMITLLSPVSDSPIFNAKSMWLTFSPRLFETTTSGFVRLLFAVQTILLLLEEKITPAGAITFLSDPSGLIETIDFVEDEDELSIGIYTTRSLVIGVELIWSLQETNSPAEVAKNISKYFFMVVKNC